MDSNFKELKMLLVITGCFITSSIFGVESPSLEENKTKKMYTEEEFKQKVYNEVIARVKKLQSRPNKELTLELVEKEEKIRMQQFELVQKKRELKSNEENFSKRVQEFRKEQSKILGCLNDIDKQKNKRIANLVEIISAMRPAAASKVLSVQGPEIAVQIIGKLSPIKSSKIFNIMDQKIAAKLQKMYMNMKR